MNQNTTNYMSLLQKSLSRPVRYIILLIIFINETKSIYILVIFICSYYQSAKPQTLTAENIKKIILIDCRNEYARVQKILGFQFHDPFIFHKEFVDPLPTKICIPWPPIPTKIICKPGFLILPKKVSNIPLIEIFNSILKWILESDHSLPWKSSFKTKKNDTAIISYVFSKQLMCKLTLF